MDSFTFFYRWLKQNQSRTMLVNPCKLMRSKELKLIKTHKYLSWMEKIYLTMLQIFTTIAQSVTFSLNTTIHNNCHIYEAQYSRMTTEHYMSKLWRPKSLRLLNKTVQPKSWPKTFRAIRHPNSYNICIADKQIIKTRMFIFGSLARTQLKIGLLPSYIF